MGVTICMNRDMSPLFGVRVEWKWMSAHSVVAKNYFLMCYYTQCAHPVRIYHVHKQWYCLVVVHSDKGTYPAKLHSWKLSITNRVFRQKGASENSLQLFIAKDISARTHQCNERLRNVVVCQHTHAYTAGETTVIRNDCTVTDYDDNHG